MSIDPLKPLHQMLYFVFWQLAHYFWDHDRIGVTVSLMLTSFRIFLVEQAAHLVGLIAAALVSPAGLFITLAFLAYGLWRLLAILFPDMAWRPVELPKVLLYALLIGAFFGAPAATMILLETARQGLADAVQTAVMAELTPSFMPAGYVSGEPGLVIYDIDGQAGLSGADLAASLMGVSQIAELGRPELPAEFRTLYFSLGGPAAFALADAATRTDALLAAGRGTLVLLLAPLAIFYAIGEALLWLTLAGVALILWISLPIALLVAPFRASEGLFAVFARRYINLWIETVVSAALLALLGGALFEAATQGFGLFLALSVLAGFVVVWRVISAGKLASAALEGVGGAEVTGGVGALSAGKMAAAGGAMAVGALATGGLTAAGGALIAAGALVGRGGGEGEEGGSTGSQAAALGGFLAGKSGRVRGVMQTVQEMRLVSGLHKADEPDALDAAYVGSLLSNRGAGSAYLALGMMDGPATAYRRLGLSSGGREGREREDWRGGPPSGPGGRGRMNWGLDETGNNLADWEEGSASGRRAAAPMPPNGSRRGSLLDRLERGGQPAAAAGDTAPPPDDDGRFLTPDSGDLADQRWDGEPGAALPGTGAGLPPTGAALPGTGAGLPGTQPAAPIRFAGQPVGTELWLNVLSGVKNETWRADMIATAAQTAGPAAETVAAAQRTYGYDELVAGLKALTAQREAYQAEGLNDGQILSRFRSGEGYGLAAAGLAADSPLRPGGAGFAAWQALADMSLQPEAEVSRAHLTAALSQAVDGEETDGAAAVARALGATGHLGGYAGATRLVVERARGMGVSGERLRAADARLQGDDEEGAYRELRAAAGATDAGAQALLDDLWVLPSGNFALRQTAAVDTAAVDTAAVQGDIASPAANNTAASSGIPYYAPAPDAAAPDAAAPDAPQSVNPSQTERVADETATPDLERDGETS